MSLSVLKSYCYSLVMTTFFNSSSFLKFCIAAFALDVADTTLNLYWLPSGGIYCSLTLYRAALHFLLYISCFLLKKYLKFLCLLWSLKLSRLLKTSLLFCRMVYYSWSVWLPPCPQTLVCFWISLHLFEFAFTYLETHKSSCQKGGSKDDLLKI